MPATVLEIAGLGSSGVVVTLPPVNPEDAAYLLDEGLSTVDLFYAAGAATDLEVEGYGFASISVTPAAVNPESASYHIGGSLGSVDLSYSANSSTDLEIGGFGSVSIGVASTENYESADYDVDSGLSSVDLSFATSGATSLEIGGFGHVGFNVEALTNPESASYGLETGSSTAAVTLHPVEGIELEIGPDLTIPGIQLVVAFDPNPESAVYTLDSGDSAVSPQLRATSGVSYSIGSFDLAAQGLGALDFTVSADTEFGIAPCGAIGLVSDSVEFSFEPVGEAQLFVGELGVFNLEPCGDVKIFDSQYSPQWNIAPCAKIIVAVSTPFGEATSGNDTECGTGAFKQEGGAANVYDYIFGLQPMAVGPASFFVTFADDSGSELTTVSRTPVVSGGGEWQSYVGALECGTDLQGIAGIQNTQDILIGPFTAASQARYVSVWDAATGGAELFRIRIGPDLSFASGATATIPAGALRVGGDYAL